MEVIHINPTVGHCFGSLRNTSYPSIVRHSESDHGFWKSGHARKSTRDCILVCGTNVYCHPAMDQAGYDKILRNGRLDDFVYDGQYITLVKLFLYLEVWPSAQISSILMSAVLLNGKSYGTMATANLISWPVQSHSLWIWNAWNWHHPKAKSGHGFEGTGNILWKLIRSDELTGPSTIGTLRHFTKLPWIPQSSQFVFCTCEYSSRNGCESVAIWYLRSSSPTGSSPFSIRPFFNATQFQRRSRNQFRVIASMSAKHGRPMLVSTSRATWWFSCCQCLLSIRCRCPASLSLG